MHRPTWRTSCSWEQTFFTHTPSRHSTINDVRVLIVPWVAKRDGRSPKEHLEGGVRVRAMDTIRWDSTKAELWPSK
ncbi:MAG: hypothetical protein IPI72_13440 [Flavobacteriales bacterium]|nr:hypothetical protein [Flavobacteriales bacterium]